METLRDAAPMGMLPPAIQGWQPLTFIERGVFVPFTTPQLVGGRLRPGSRGGLELLLPDVAGPGSVGVLGWEHVGSLCSPTVFDRRLASRLLALPSLSPAAVREAAYLEAAGGFAGAEAQKAAAIAQQADTAERERARAALLDCAPGTSAATALSELADLLAPVGLGELAEEARLPRTLGAALVMAGQLGGRQQAGSSVADAEVVAAALRQVTGGALTALTSARAAAADPVALLRRWLAAPSATAAELSRAEWLLDGWAWLCALWSFPDERFGQILLVLPEMASLMLPLPREAGRVQPLPTRREMPRSVRTVLRSGDWRNGVTPQDLVSRNEKLLAAMLAPTEATP